MTITELIDDLTELIYEKTLTKKYRRVTPFNNRLGEFQKVWIKTPRCKTGSNVYLNMIKYPQYNQNSVNMRLTLHKQSELYKFIRRAERIIKYEIREIDDTLTLKSCITHEKPFPPMFNISLPYEMIDNVAEFSFHIYNHNKKRVSLKEIKTGLDCMAFVELTDVWMTDEKFGLNWNLLQLLLIPPLDFTKCMFDDIIDIPTPDTECYHCLYCPTDHIRTRLIPTPFSPLLPPPPPPFLQQQPIKKNPPPLINTAPRFAISVADIKSIKLKPPKKIDKPIETSNKLTNAISNLKKMETSVYSGDKLTGILLE